MSDTYLFYVDDSGQRDGPDVDYFVLGSVGVPMNEWHSLNRQITDLKWSYFRDPGVEMKSTWLRSPREKQKRYLSRFNISNQELDDFVRAVYDAILSHEVQIVAAVIDRARFPIRCRTGETPLSMAYTILFERIERCMQKTDGRAILIFDKIEDNEMKRVGYEKHLAEQHEQHREEGTEFVDVRCVVEDLFFVRSSQNNGVQLADLCSYNIFRQFRDYGDHFHDKRGFLVDDRYEFFKLIEPKFFRMAKGGRYAQHALRRCPTKNAKDWKEYGGRHGVIAINTKGHRTEEVHPPDDIQASS